MSDYRCWVGVCWRVTGPSRGGLVPWCPLRSHETTVLDVVVVAWEPVLSNGKWHMTWTVAVMMCWREEEVDHGAQLLLFGVVRFVNRAFFQIAGEGFVTTELDAMSASPTETVDSCEERREEVMKEVMSWEIESIRRQDAVTGSARC